MTRELFKKKIPILFLKLDIAKAFDSINWGYILETMERLGSGHRWREWIFILFGTMTSQVMLKSHPGKSFQHRRGVRQGDSLSSMLFILAIDPLQKILYLATHHNILSLVPSTAVTISEGS